MNIEDLLEGNNYHDIDIIKAVPFLLIETAKSKAKSDTLIEYISKNISDDEVVKLENDFEKRYYEIIAEYLSKCSK